MNPRTDNDFMFGTNGKELRPMLPVAIKTKQQAYRTAAWLRLMAVTLTDEEVPNSSFDEVFEAVSNS